MNTFLWGALCMACVVVAMMFARFYWLSRERLFIFFAIAFSVFAFHWGVLGVVAPASERLPYVYLLRLAAFVCIIVGVVDRNRRR